MAELDANSLVASWLNEGRAKAVEQGVEWSPPKEGRLSLKFRRAYEWIVAHAIHCPYQDIEFGPRRHLGGSELGISVAQGEGYSSFILLPLLTLITSRRLLFVGAPGRGKTTAATLMALLTGEDLKGTRRSIQHGHPQMTATDLLGAPLPGDLVRAEQASDIKVAWRGWLGKRVKIIDEYNRIPTKTQSALLSLMADGYAEVFEEVYTCDTSAWFLTANDDMGGGTFPVIEALRDRIDVVARCTPFNGRFLESLVSRIESGHTPESFVPADVVFTAEELAEVDAQVRAVPLAQEVADVLAFFAGQLDFCRQASSRLDYMNKDTLHLAGRKVGHVCNEDCPLDKSENICTQTESGISARAYQSLLHYGKALAWFRGQEEVTLEDISALLPWVLHDKLAPNRHSVFFQKPDTATYLSDRVSWIHQLFDKALVQHAAYARVRQEVADLKGRVESELGVLEVKEIQALAKEIGDRMERVVKEHELNGPVYDDLVMLKNLHFRCSREVELRRRRQ